MLNETNESAMQLQQLRTDIARQGRELLAKGLTTGTSGNISVRDKEHGLVAITPSGVPYGDLTAEDICLVDGQGQVVSSTCRPSSELPMHLAVYDARSDVHAVVHTHSVYATTLACLRIPLPAMHYLVGFAGTSVPCAEYATFGSPELAEKAITAMGSTNAVLLANHGLLAAGVDLQSAMRVAEEVEFVARLYVQARSIGEPVVIDDTEMLRVIDLLADYGRPHR